MPRRYSEADTRRVFARAAEMHRADAPDDGLTLAELQEIGRAAGLDPAHVAAAVAGLDAPADARDGASFLGVPAVRRWTRVLPLPVSDPAWEAIVADLRRTFKQPGVPSQIGRVREWTAARSYGSDGLRVALEPTEGGTRATVEHVLAENVSGLRVISASTLAVPAVMTLFPLISGEAKMWMLPAMMLVVFALVSVLVAGILHSQTRKTARLAERVLDRMDLAVRDAGSDVRPAAATLDPSHLDDPVGDAAPGRAERRRGRGRA